MQTHSHAVVLAFVMAGQVVTTSARAQAADSLTRVKSEGAVATAAPVDTTPKKKGGGMFGKLKSVAHNKTVQNITKAAVCQALPGGQYMVGAAEAAKNKTSIASGVANAGSCIPGMGGAAGMGMGGGKGALAGAAVGAASSIGAGKPGVPGAAGAMAGMMNVPGGRGAGGAPSVTAMAQSLAAMQTAMAQMNAASAANAGGGGAAVAAGATTAEVSTEASGQQIKLSGDVPSEIKKGKLVIKKIDWIRGAANISAPSTEGFMNLMQSAGQAIKAAGGTYRVDVYMDKKYSDAEIAQVGTQRGLVLVSLLQAGGQLGDAVMSGKIGKEKEQRVEIVKVK